MKKRNGFVSNSSSSSFIVVKEDDSTVEELVEVMLRAITEHWSEFPEEIWDNALANAVKEDVINGEYGIHMPSCNYDTYMLVKHDWIYVTTCNNHCWDEVHEKFEVVGTGGGADYGDEDRCQAVCEDAYFYDARNNIIHSMQIYSGYDGVTRLECQDCDRHYGAYYVLEDGTKVCEYCYSSNLKEIEDEDS